MLYEGLQGCVRKGNVSIHKIADSGPYSERWGDIEATKIDALPKTEKIRLGTIVVF